MQQELAKIGIRVELHLVSFATYLALSHKPRTTPFAYASWTKDYPDPSNFLEPLFAGFSIHEDDTNNTSFYSNPRLDEILKRAREEQDTKKRYAMYDEASRIVCDDAPWAFTHYYHWYSVHQPYMRGYAPHPVAVTYVANAWLDRAAMKTAARSIFGGGALGSLLR
jgi:peptide/nickel transport system substrate-binding protein